MVHKKKLIILFFIALLFLAIIFISIGIYFNRLSNPKNIMNQAIDMLSLRLQNDLIDSVSHNLGDSVTTESTIQFQLDSEKYRKEKDQNPESLKKYHLLKNLSQLKSSFTLMQDQKNKKAFLSIHQMIGSEELLHAKYVIDNSTKYYFVNNVLKNYVNDGNCSYFETLSSENTSFDNIQYLYSFIEDSLKNQLKEEYFKVYYVDENIQGKKRSVREISLRITDKVIRIVLNGVLSDLKHDDMAMKILTGIDENFSKKKISNKTFFLDSDESYTVHIYTSPILCKPLKYELVYLKGDETKSITYEGNEVQGDFYYIENDQVQKRIVVHFQKNHIEFLIYDSKDEKIGSFEYNRNDNGITIDFDYDDSKEKYNIVYSSKFENVKSHSYDNHKKLSIKIVQNKIGILDGIVMIDTKAKKDVKISEDVSNAVLASTLSEEQKKQFQNISSRVLERLEK